MNQPLKEGRTRQSSFRVIYPPMGYDSIPIAASNAKEFGKKKRVNRAAKLKQSKLDVRREQWLSQVKNKGCKEETNGVSGVKMPAERNDINPSGEENEGLRNLCSDSESPFNSPMSSVFGSNRSPSHFTSNSSSSSSSGGCCSESMTEEDDGDNECLDDWEAIADALAADDIKNDNLESPEPDSVTATMEASQDDCCARAWRADDVFRPQSLPNLLKQNSFPCFKNVCSPSTCPICCEDLDLTDTSFLPCPCGYRLCLFCHKRILEDDGRCPGCRKQYDHHGPGNLSSKMGRSYSMIPRR
ncbi:unnamed protein product [Lactuca saligna]|uniref:RING-type domain-containing protein n=1 Tax=Lactuca saligna TaxID=75948 RepID=A0AA35VU31_LACSI|nr:unnamed protein product [Lactuca saligna]